MKKPSVDSVKLLLVDSDIQIAKVVQNSLLEMGFRKIHHVRNSTDALVYISKEEVDILITEWLISPMNGVELVRHLRLSKNSPNRGIPIIMLTGKGEMVDVMTARDVGITEFLVKPFTIQNLYDRLEYLIERPRDFVLSEQFVGPDRRRKNRSAKITEERRKFSPKKIAKPEDGLPPPNETPLLVLPDHQIKQKIGLLVSLSNIITPEMLRSAQDKINAMQDESMAWIREDMEELERSFQIFQENASDVGALANMQSAALAIKSRSGIFGFSIPSEIGRMLYLFLCTDYIPLRKVHNATVQQCIESLKVVFANDPTAKTGLPGQLVKELEDMIQHVVKNGK